MAKAPSKKAGRPKTQPAETQDSPTREEIAKRAYEIYVRRGGAQGQDVADWLQAERELCVAARR